MTDFLSLTDLDVASRRVLLRSDLNVPLSDGIVTDDFRLRSALPTIQQVRDADAIVVLCSHLGRPNGPDPNLSLKPVAEALSALGGFDVTHAGDTAGPQAAGLVANASPGDVILLENTRFEPGETTNDPELSARLAHLADVFVLDAFGTAHRAHASTVGVAGLLRSAAGPLLEAELAALNKLLIDPPRPFTVVLGGAKVSDKLPVMEALLPKVDLMLVGGGMCFTILEVEGYEIGNSLVEKDIEDDIERVLGGADGGKVTIPTDVVVADRFAPDAAHEVVKTNHIDHEWLGLDIGPVSAANFASVIRGSGSVFWNGPMGVFEWDSFRAGTETVARAVADTNGFTVAGGGDSVAALRLLGLDGALSHLSTGGGASLELLEGKTLPGVAALKEWV